MARRVDADRTHRRPAAAHHGRRPQALDPDQITIFADGQPVRTLPVPHVSRGARDGTERTVEMHFDPVTGKDLHIQIDAYRPQLVLTGPESGPALMPVSITRPTCPGSPSRRRRPPSTPGAAAISSPWTARRSRCRWWGRAATPAAGSTSSRVRPAWRSARVRTPCGPRRRAGTGFAVDRVVLSSDRREAAPVTRERR